jgi:hypothetical protein
MWALRGSLQKMPFLATFHDHVSRIPEGVFSLSLALVFMPFFHDSCRLVSWVIIAIHVETFKNLGPTWAFLKCPLLSSIS